MSGGLGLLAEEAWQEGSVCCKDGEYEGVMAQNTRSLRACQNSPTSSGVMEDTFVKVRQLVRAGRG